MTTKRTLRLLAILFGFVLFAAACGDDDSSNDAGDSGDMADEGGDYLVDLEGRTITIAATRQAQVLENAKVLFNSAGAAPGQQIELRSGKILFVLPGPPSEFNAILKEEVIPWLQVRYADIKPNYVSYVRTKGIGESDIVTILEDANFQPLEVELGFYPGQGKVKIRIFQ